MFVSSETRSSPQGPQHVTPAEVRRPKILTFLTPSVPQHLIVERSAWGRRGGSRAGPETLFFQHLLGPTLEVNRQDKAAT